jgi:glutaconyl-CoA/methylmalonyl-CoA decarboxylase subunit gamma
MKKLRITVDGKVFDVQVEDIDDSNSGSLAGRPPVTLAASSAPISAPPVSSSSAASAGGPGDVVSPLAGRVISIDCKVGDKVDVGAQLLTIEAMKMNTYVNAGAAGTVSAVHVNAGDAVEEGQPLVTVK